MYPAASVSGFYFAHPEARYFAVDFITRDQVQNYAAGRALRSAKSSAGSRRTWRTTRIEGRQRFKLFAISARRRYNKHERKATARERVTAIRSGRPSSGTTAVKSPFLLRRRRGESVMVRTNHWSLRYGIAVVAIIWSTASLLLVPMIGRSGAAIPFFAVLISTWFGGLGPGVFTHRRGRRPLSDRPGQSRKQFPGLADPSDRFFRRGRGDDHGTRRGAPRRAAAGRGERAVALGRAVEHRRCRDCHRRARARLLHQSGRPVPDRVGRGRGEGQAPPGRFRRRLGRRIAGRSSPPSPG